MTEDWRNNLSPFRDFYYTWDRTNNQWVISDNICIEVASVFYFSGDSYRIDEAIEYFYGHKKPLFKGL